MKTIWIVAIVLSIVSTVIVVVTVPLVFHFRKENHNGLSTSKISPTITTQSNTKYEVELIMYVFL